MYLKISVPRNRRIYRSGSDRELILTIVEKNADVTLIGLTKLYILRPIQYKRFLKEAILVNLLKLRYMDLKGLMLHRKLLYVN